MTNIQNLKNVINEMSDKEIIDLFFDWSYGTNRFKCPLGAKEASGCGEEIGCRDCYKIWGQAEAKNPGSFPIFIDIHAEDIYD